MYQFVRTFSTRGDLEAQMLAAGQHNRRKLLLQAKAELTADGNGIMADSAGGAMADDQRTKLKTINADLTWVNEGLDAADKQAAHDRTLPAITLGSDGRGNTTYTESRRRPASMMGYDPAGNAIPILGPNDRFADLECSAGSGNGAPGADPVTVLGDVVKGMATGRWGTAAGLQAQHGGSGLTGGGVLLSLPVSARTIDLARAKSRVVQAGAMTVPMENRELTIAKITGNPSASWRAENVSLPTGEIAFAGVKLTARSLGVITKSSIELVEDAANLGALIEGTLSEVLGLELDRVALLGDGAASEPLGIQKTSGIGTITAVGTPAYADFSNAVEDVQEANGEASAVILAPRTLGTLDRLQDTTNQPMRPPESWGTLRKLGTTQVPTNLGAGTDESLAFVGDFSNVWIGMRRNVTIEVSRTAGSSSNSAFTDMQVWVRAYLRADIAVVRPDHFVLLSGITT